MAARPAHVAFTLIETMHAVEMGLEKALEQVGLSLAKYGVISKLAEAGEPLNLSTLAERCSCVRSNMTQLIDRLEDEGLVQRVADPQDRRAIRARLTPLGEQRHADGVRVLEGAERELLNRLKGPQRTTLLDVLRELRSA
jgi:DNA-binding MarR family transcriptional regulator